MLSSSFDFFNTLIRFLRQGSRRVMSGDGTHKNSVLFSFQERKRKMSWTNASWKEHASSIVERELSQ
jgi:hypothetical protein